MTTLRSLQYGLWLLLVISGLQMFRILVILHQSQDQGHLLVQEDMHISHIIKTAGYLTKNAVDANRNGTVMINKMQSSDNGGMLSKGNLQNRGFISRRGDLEEQLKQYRQNLDPSSVPSHLCVAVLTGYPKVADRKELVLRLLGQLLNDLPLPHDNVSLHLHVFCEGRCTSLATRYPSAAYHFLNPHVKMIRSRLTLKVRSLTENYRLMMETLFMTLQVDTCVILEDDLILAPDALLALSHAHNLVLADTTILAVSLYNDNSYPTVAADPAVWRRVSHFAGLGFLISQRSYVLQIRNEWTIHKPWDVILQTATGKHRMSSIIPEISRSQHMSDPQLTIGQSVKAPLNGFQSSVINSEICPHYDFNNLVTSSYDLYIRKYIFSATSIEHLEDAYFVYNGSNLIFWKCQSQGVYLSDLLRDRHLAGMGNGHMVRGVYKGTLFLRMCEALVLIVCKDSPFYMKNLISKHTLKHHISTLKTTKNTFSGSAAGVYHRLTSHYRLVTGLPGESCQSACSQSSLQCDVAGLWLLNRDCDVLRALFPGCTTCDTLPQRRRRAPSHYLPALLPTEHCLTGYSHFLTCYGKYKDFRRLCTCV